MSLARAYQVPRSVLLGEGTRSVTTYEYDDETGRLVRSVTVHESPWTEENRGWGIAYEAYLSDLCPRCKRPLSETTAMKDGAALHTYDVDHPMRCHSCDEMIKKQEAHGKSGQVIRPEALIWTSQRRDS
jgi:hypothetical protein